VFFPGGGKTFIVTSTAKPETFEKYAPTFDEILASFQAPAPLASSPRLFHGPGFDQWGAVIGGIVGALVAGLVVVGSRLLKWLSSRSKH
jgi:hypothetical protein